jgi:hypothetical protein
MYKSDHQERWTSSTEYLEIQWVYHVLVHVMQQYEYLTIFYRLLLRYYEVLFVSLSTHRRRSALAHIDRRNHDRNMW